MATVDNIDASANEIEKITRNWQAVCIPLGIQSVSGKDYMETPRKVSDAGELLPILWQIAFFKDSLPFQLRGWLNLLGLCVQMRGGYLQAGGQFKAYFQAAGQSTSVDPAQTNSWPILRFDQRTWNRRFAHLVWPTLDMGMYVFQTVMATGGFTKRDIAIITRARNDFKKTGRWPGVTDLRCMNCDQHIAIWDFPLSGPQPCPHCGETLKILV